MGWRGGDISDQVIARALIEAGAEAGLLEQTRAELA